MKVSNGQLTVVGVKQVLSAMAEALVYVKNDTDNSKPTYILHFIAGPAHFRSVFYNKDEAAESWALLPTYHPLPSLSGQQIVDNLRQMLFVEQTNSVAGIQVTEGELAAARDEFWVVARSMLENKPVVCPACNQIH
jgi:hypothetical protein